MPGKVFCSVLLKRLRDAVDILLREEQAGFRRGRSCSDQIFVLRNIIEQSNEFQKPLLLNFVDFTKAFDSLHRDSIWKILRYYGIPQIYINLFKNLYQGSTCSVRTDGGCTEDFSIVTGVRQGCVLSPLLFVLVIDFIMRHSVNGPRYGIPWSDDVRLTDLAYADDVALLAGTQPALQEMTSHLATEAKKFGLHINCKKTKTMSVCRSTKINLALDGKPIEEVQDFIYLGSIMSKNGGTDADVRRRIGLATMTFQKMRKIWATKSVNLTTKIRLYRSCVVPIATYASETWRATKMITHRLNVFNQKCLRKILGIRFSDHIRNEEVLKRSEVQTIAGLIKQKRVRWAGHVLRMPECRHPKTAFSLKPRSGKRSPIDHLEGNLQE